ncbi:uncharacterized protein LOC110907009 isoform X2 [Helianthus annuus]|uniref:uncharacterized protein LOC110907009 isoform X2 n=1 Tax=Helianthus annuus TaxID=4232 RepID=UPI0016534108|nr:uncharacterized protein LOC110907009 isoform X2 [Helianthus annuus]
MNGELRALGQKLDLSLVSCDVDVVAAGKRPNIELDKEHYRTDGHCKWWKKGGYHLNFFHVDQTSSWIKSIIEQIETPDLKKVVAKLSNVYPKDTKAPAGGVDHMTKLSYLHEPGVLQKLRIRYELNDIFYAKFSSWAFTKNVFYHVQVRGQTLSWIKSIIEQMVIANGGKKAVDQTSSWIKSIIEQIETPDLKKVVAKLSNVYPKDTEAPAGGVDHMTKLSYLHEPGVLQKLRIRYELNDIFYAKFSSWAFTKNVFYHVQVRGQTLSWIKSIIEQMVIANGGKKAVDQTSSWIKSIIEQIETPDLKKVVAKLSNVYPKDTEAPAGGVDHMTKLSYLHEPGVLQKLRIRYELNDIFYAKFSSWAFTKNVFYHVQLRDQTLSWIKSIIEQMVIANGGKKAVDQTSSWIKSIIEQIETPKLKKVVAKLSNVYPKDTEAPAGGVDHMTKLSYLHEPGVLQNLRIRYELNEIYTCTGNVLIAINPFQKLPHLYDGHMKEEYKGALFGELSPHVFAVANAFYRAMI